MKTAGLLLAVILALAACALAACARTPPRGDAAHGAATSPGAAGGQADLAEPAVPAEGSSTLAWQPGRDRVLARGDGDDEGLEWLPLGMDTGTLLSSHLYGLLVAEAALTDTEGESLGRTLPAGAKVRVLAAGEWVAEGTTYTRRWEVVDDTGVQGAAWVDADAVAVILAEDRGVAAGLVPRRIVTGGGVADYSLLAVASAGRVTLIDTSSFPYPDAFHPSGVRSLAVGDPDGDGAPDVILGAETIVSLRYLGATPLRWTAWLAARQGGWRPVLLFNESFGTDAGISYATNARAVDHDGDGSADYVRLDTTLTLSGEDREFTVNTVSFLPREGAVFRKDALQDLPQRGTVRADVLDLRAAPAADAEVTASARRGGVLYVFDRGDVPLGDGASWWFRVLTRDGGEGWVDGAALQMTWIDPLKENRGVFLGTETAP